MPRASNYILELIIIIILNKSSVVLSIGIRSLGIHSSLTLPSGSVVKIRLPTQKIQETRVWSLGQEDSLEKEMATHSSILAWEIPWTETPGGLKSMGLRELDVTKQAHMHL